MIRFILTFFLLTALLGCADKEKNKPRSKEWANQMQKTAQSFKNLVPELYSEERFTDKKNAPLVLKKIKNYRDNIHDIKKGVAIKLLGEDPYVLKSVRTLEDLADRALRLYKRGDRDNSRILLKATTNTCFKCHTRQNLGPKSLSWSGFDPDSHSINPFEKAQMFVALRQYDKAQKNLVEFLEEKEAKKSFSMTYDDALTYYLMISLRGDSDYSKTRRFLKDRIHSTKLPTRLHYKIKNWDQDLAAYEKKDLPTGILGAKEVLKRNREAHSDKNLVNDLIASQILHQYLMTKPIGSSQAKAYYLLGKTYEDIVTAGYWNLPELYFELCIDQVPHSKLAQSCYKRYRENIVLGYSGSSGTLIPEDEYRRLKTLREKAAN